MKKVFLLLASAALAFTACSDNEPVGPTEKFDVISFESTDNLRDIEGSAVVLGTAEVVGGSVSATHQNVFWAKGGVFTDYTVAGTYGNLYDGPLCGTADEKVWFGTYYCDNVNYGPQADSWGGFVLSQNCNTTATTLDYNNQFALWTKGGAAGTKTFLVGYDSAWNGKSYALPTIEFIEPRTVDHLYLANSTLSCTYTPSANVPANETYYYKVVITGKLDGEEVGKVECLLIEGDRKVGYWCKVALRSLGEVDCLEFKPASNDKSSGYMNDPTYFGLDQIALVRK